MLAFTECEGQIIEFINVSKCDPGLFVRHRANPITQAKSGEDGTADDCCQCDLALVRNILVFIGISGDSINIKAGVVPGGRLGRSSPLKPAKATLFTMIL